MKPKLTNDRDRAEWLQCLQAAATATSESRLTDAAISAQVSVPTILARTADLLFEELRERCEQ